jgi:hypothetical protein
MSTVPTRQPQQQSALSGDEHQLMMVAQKLKAQQEGSALSPIMPPTKFDAEAGLGNGPPMPPGAK